MTLVRVVRGSRNCVFVCEKAFGYSDRYSLIIDLSGKVITWFQYRDANLCMSYRPADCEPETCRKLLLGALRYGKPFVIDMLSLALDEEAFTSLLEPILPGLFDLLLSKRILEEENYTKLIRYEDGDEYTLKHWREKNLQHFHFVVITKLPTLPDWMIDRFFVLKVAA